MKVSDVNIEDEYMTVNGEDTIFEVAKKIAESGIPDAVVVDAEGHTLGALDDYDIVTKVIAQGKDPKTLKAKEVMYAPPPVKLETELETAHNYMEELEVTMLPVVDETKKLIGVITVMDVLEAKAQESQGKGNFLAKIFGL